MSQCYAIYPFVDFIRHATFTFRSTKLAVTYAYRATIRIYRDVQIIYILVRINVCHGSVTNFLNMPVYNGKFRRVSRLGLVQIYLFEELRTTLFGGPRLREYNP